MLKVAFDAQECASVAFGSKQGVVSIYKEVELKRKKTSSASRVDEHLFRDEQLLRSFATVLRLLTRLLGEQRAQFVALIFILQFDPYFIATKEWQCKWWVVLCE